MALLLLDIQIDKLPFSMKIYWSPLKVFRSLIRFLACKKAFRTEFEIQIFDFSRLN